MQPLIELDSGVEGASAQSQGLYSKGFVVDCTLEMTAALAVSSAPESGGAIFTARQQPLPIWAEAEPVNTSLMIRANFQR